jgi:hypothetical protein
MSFWLFLISKCVEQWRLVVFVLEEASQNVRDIYLCAVKNLFKKLAQIQDV